MRQSILTYIRLTLRDPISTLPVKSQSLNLVLKHTLVPVLLFSSRLREHEYTPFTVPEKDSGFPGTKDFMFFSVYRYKFLFVFPSGESLVSHRVSDG